MEMTREEIIKIVQAMWKYKDCGYSEYEIRKALDEVLKMLEQDPITKLKRIQEIVNKPTFKEVQLDKVKQVREEIQKCVDMLSDDTLADLNTKVGLGTALEKIDKLIEESEDKE